MIHYVKGDATAPIGDGHKIIVHCCNNAGAWGAGFVLALSRKWPHVEKAYLAQRGYKLGAVQFAYAEESVTVANLIGQDGCGFRNGQPPVRYPAIYAGLIQVAYEARQLHVPYASIHMPRMGCGLAGGTWTEMEPIINQALEGLDVYVYDLEGA